MSPEEMATWHVAKIQEAHEDGFRYGLGLAIQTFERAGETFPAISEEMREAVQLLTSTVVSILRDTSAKFTLTESGDA